MEPISIQESREISETFCKRYNLLDKSDLIPARLITICQSDISINHIRMSNLSVFCDAEVTGIGLRSLIHDINTLLITITSKKDKNNNVLIYRMTLINITGGVTNGYLLANSLIKQNDEEFCHAAVMHP